MLLNNRWRKRHRGNTSCGTGTVGHQGKYVTLATNLRQQTRCLTTKEVMHLLQLRRNTVCDWVTAGKMPAIRTSSGYRFDPMALASWIEARTTGVVEGRS